MLSADRAGTLAAVDTAYASLWDIVRGIDEATGTRAGLVGAWSVAQTLAHMVGWLEVWETALTRMARGERPTPVGVDYDNVDAWNAKFVEVHTRPTLAQAVTAFAAGFTAFRAALSALPEERFGAGRTANRIAFNPCVRHFGTHQAEIERALRG